MAEQMPILGDLNPIAGFADIALIAEQAAVLAAGDLAQHAGGGQYQFSPPELQSVLHQWSDLETTITNALQHMHRSAPRGAGAIAPGNEQASDSVATAANQSNDAYVTYLTSMQAYAHGYVEKLTAALNLYHQTEYTNSSLASGAQGHLQA
jgi:hypothetical protein